jgi:hypothetical protein
MKLIRFTTADSQGPYFGLFAQDQAVPFLTLQRKAGKFYPHLNDSRPYLTNLPESRHCLSISVVW